MSASPVNSPRSLIALDYGLRRIGVATGSTIAGTASALETMTARGDEPDWQRLEALLREWTPDVIVIGLPFNADGSESDMTVAARDFAAEVKSRFDLPVEFVDERYTSAEAETLLREQRRQGIRTRKLSKEDVDAVAAQLIAESWLSSAH